jgi:hypothetical protein
MTFHEWLKEEFGQGWQGIHMDLLVEGYNEEQLSERKYELEEEYREYCEEEDIEPEID